jgi:hypothetical protein
MERDGIIIAQISEGNQLNVAKQDHSHGGVNITTSTEEMKLPDSSRRKHCCVEILTDVQNPSLPSSRRPVYDHSVWCTERATNKFQKTDLWQYNHSLKCTKLQRIEFWKDTHATFLVLSVLSVLLYNTRAWVLVFCETQQHAEQLAQIPRCITEFLVRMTPHHVSARAAIIRRYSNTPYTTELCLLYGSIHCTNHCVTINRQI